MDSAGDSSFIIGRRPPTVRQVTIDLTTPAPTPAEHQGAAAFFTARLRYQTDVADVRAALAANRPGFVLVDSRGGPAWRQGHIPGALHLPTDEIPERAPHLLDPAVPLVTYCWGPGCNGATKAALTLSRLGYRVRDDRWDRVLDPGGLPGRDGHRHDRRGARSADRAMRMLIRPSRTTPPQEVPYQRGDQRRGTVVAQPAGMCGRRHEVVAEVYIGAGAG